MSEVALKRYALYRANREAMDHLRDLYESEPGPTDAPVMLLYGEARTGKSRVVKETFAEELKPVKVGPNQFIRKVVFVEAANRTTFVGLAREVLRRMEIRYADKSNVTEDQLMARICDAVQEQQTRLICIDEVEITKDIKKTISASNFFRSFSNRARCSLLLMGLPDIVELTRETDAFDGRNEMPVEIPRFNFNDREDRKEWRMILKLIEVQESSRFAPGSISETVPAARLWLATDGVIGFLLRLLKAGMKVAERSGDPFVTMEHLQVAYNRLSKISKRGPRFNPFDSTALPDARCSGTNINLDSSVITQLAATAAG